MPNNDFDGWAMYIKIDDSVFRINFIQAETGTIKYDLITPDFIYPTENNANYIFNTIIENAIFKKNNPEGYCEYKNCYKFIRRYN